LTLEIDRSIQNIPHILLYQTRILIGVSANLANNNKDIFQIVYN